MACWTGGLASDVVAVDGLGSPTTLLQLEALEWDSVQVAIVKFNRPESLNPVDKETIRALRHLLEQLTSSVASGPHAIVITGNGSSFSAGGDLKGYQTLYRDGDRFRQFMDDFEAVCDILESCSAITAAMVNGTCVAGGLEVSLACDIVTIAESARIGDGHLKFAQLPGAGGSQRLVKAIGSSRATKWLLSGHLYGADEAEAAGLVALRSPLPELRTATLDLVASIARHSPLGRRLMKELISTAENNSLTDGLKREQDLVFGYATTSHDATEGLNAFAEKRSPTYLGR